MASYEIGVVRTRIVNKLSWWDAIIVFIFAAALAFFWIQQALQRISRKIDLLVERVGEYIHSRPAEVRKDVQDLAVVLRDQSKAAQALAVDSQTSFQRIVDGHKNG